MKHDSLYIIMPAYNEEKNIGTVIEQWYPVVERIGGDSRLVILNDGSKDATYKKIQNYQKNHDRLIGIDKPNEGHGGTNTQGISLRSRKRCRLYFSDGFRRPDTSGGILQFWKNVKSAGFLSVIGRERGWAFQDFCDKNTAACAFSYFWNLGKRCKYAISADGWKTARQSTKRIPSGFFLSNVLMTVIYEKHHLYVEYIPITFRPRQAGKTLST